MKNGKVAKIDYSRWRLGLQADKLYNEGKFLSALRLAYRQYTLYGGDIDLFARFSDIYESLGLHASAINWHYRMLDRCVDEDLPDIYEGLAVNYLNMGNESQAAYYYNQLIDVDDALPNEMKMEIVRAFSKDKKDGFRFVYPPKLADYSKELDVGAKALKMGDVQRAIDALSDVEKGSGQYAQAMEMQAVAQLLAGDVNAAERICEELLEENPDDVKASATLCAVYLEQGKREESAAIAKRLSVLELTETEDLYKVATVCCENDLHAAAYEKFCIICERTPYDGRTLYFKAVSALKCGKRKEAEETLDTLCTLYPDAEVAKYYLRFLRENGEDVYPEITYFYHLPQEEREERCRALINIGKCPKDEAQLFAVVALYDGYFKWCFDEMDGNDHDLQYLALVTAEHVRADEFLEEVLLDDEVLDVLKVETLRMLFARNEESEWGVVLCHIYRKVRILPLQLGRKRRKRLLEGYAKVASKFAIFNHAYAKKIRTAAQTLYSRLEEENALDLLISDDDCACAIFLLAGLKELGTNRESIAKAFDADCQMVEGIIDIVNNGSKQNTQEENANETD